MCPVSISHILVLLGIYRGVSGSHTTTPEILINDHYLIKASIDLSNKYDKDTALNLIVEIHGIDRCETFVPNLIFLDDNNSLIMLAPVSFIGNHIINFKHQKHIFFVANLIFSHNHYVYDIGDIVLPSKIFQSQTSLSFLSITGFFTILLSLYVTVLLYIYSINDKRDEDFLDILLEETKISFVRSNEN